MKKHIICMGNSYKNGGRCLAGIEISLNENSYSIVRNEDGNVNWIRPVNEDDTLGLDEDETSDFNILDILEINVIEAVPCGAHSENVLYSSMKKVARCKKSDSNLRSLCDNSHSRIFGNYGKAVSDEIFMEGGYSLMLIKPENPRFVCQEDPFGRMKFRAEFSYEGHFYDFPITDPVFLNELKSNSNLWREFPTGSFYFCLSLGVNFNDWHFKLVAGIVNLNNAA